MTLHAMTINLFKLARKGEFWTPFNTSVFSTLKVEEELRRQPVCENGETQTDVRPQFSVR